MAPQAANDAYTWVPPTPGNASTGVMGEAGHVPLTNAEATTLSWTSDTPNTGYLAGMGYTLGWTCQTYLSLGTAGIVQTYSVEAPAEPEPEPEPVKTEAPEPAKFSTKTKAGK